MAFFVVITSPSLNIRRRWSDIILQYSSLQDLGDIDWGWGLLLLQEMYYKVELICHHEPHQCRCRHNIATEVNTEDLTANLIRCNPGLLKYIGRTNVSTNREVQGGNVKVEGSKIEAEEKVERPYRSIVEEKGLNFLLKDEPQQRPAIPQNLNKKLSEPALQPLQTQPIVEQRPSPSNIPQQQKIKPHPQSKKEKEVKQFHKDLKNQSRYLSNTAFRKYFDRQCFENYGNQNVHHKADGFVYGNYLKTYNINPHSGQNMPSNEQTFYHALVTASPEKYVLQTQEVKMSHVSPKKAEVVASHSLEKSKLNMEKMLQDNMKHSKLEKKYDHLKLKHKEGSDHAVKERVAMKSEGKPQVVTNNYVSNQNIDSRYSPKELQLQSRKYIGSPQLRINPNAISNASIQQQYNPKRAESIVIQAENVPVAINSPTNKSTCNHKEGEQSTECECCLNQMKALILTLADSDPDLASRIVASAKKATLYKNFALNNYDRAAMNPHNYRSDGRLNVYEH